MMEEHSSAGVDGATSGSSSSTEDGHRHSGCGNWERDIQGVLQTIHAQQTTVSGQMADLHWRFTDATDTFNLDAEARKAAEYLEKLGRIRRRMSGTQLKLAELRRRSQNMKKDKEAQYVSSYDDWLAHMEYQDQLIAKFEPPKSKKT